ncbi:hypothetical protein D3C85_1328220 [compost metagenome]
MTAQVEHLLGLGDVARGVAAGQGPGHFQAVAYTPAEQFADRQALAFALSIEQGAFDPRAGKGIALDHLVQALHGGVDVAGIQAGQQRREIAVDILLDAFRAFVAIGQATDGGGFAEAFDTVAALQADDHQGLLLHGVHRQLVRANGWQVDDQGRDALNQGMTHQGSPGALNRGRRRRPAAPCR